MEKVISVMYILCVVNGILAYRSSELGFTNLQKSEKQFQSTDRSNGKQSAFCVFLQRYSKDIIDSSSNLYVY